MNTIRYLPRTDTREAYASYDSWTLHVGFWVQSEVARTADFYACDFGLSNDGEIVACTVDIPMSRWHIASDLVFPAMQGQS